MLVNSGVKLIKGGKYGGVSIGKLNFSEFARAQLKRREPLKTKINNWSGTHVVQPINNWSGTHIVQPNNFFEPSSEQELVELLAGASRSGIKLRPIGAAISPNGIGMEDEGMISLGNLNQILNIDQKNCTITVQAGATVAKVITALEPYGLMLENFSSIQTQQLGGWTQIAAHGTGARLSTVEEQIIKMRVVTPSKGIIELSADKIEDQELMSFMKVGLGCLGVVSEVTLQCIPSHLLLQQNYNTTFESIKRDHYDLLKKHRHVRYMWIPYTDQIVIELASKYDPNAETSEETSIMKNIGKVKNHNSAKEEAITLFRKLSKTISKAQLKNMSYTEIRDRLYDIDPTNHKHVAIVNSIEAKYYASLRGYRIDTSTQLLSFNCGGPQWVLEVAFPIGSLEKKTGKDLEFTRKLIKKIEELKLPAHSPIEQRWSCSSTSKMSPVYSTNKNEIFSWVGIIMYLPPSANFQYQGDSIITQEFAKIVKALEPLYDEYNAIPHWAKVEIPKDDGQLEALKNRLRTKYDLHTFRQVRKEYDPNEILSSPLMDTLVFDNKPKAKI